MTSLAVIVVTLDDLFLIGLLAFIFVSSVFSVVLDSVKDALRSIKSLSKLRDCLRRCGFRIEHRQEDPPWTNTQQHGNNETGEDK